MENPIDIEEMASLLGLLPDESGLRTLYYYNHLGCPRMRAGKKIKYFPSKVFAWLEKRTMKDRLDPKQFANQVIR